MKKINKKLRGPALSLSNGFTLAEVLIVVFIITIFSSIAMTSYLKARDQKAVEYAAREVASHLRELQNNALTGKKDLANDERNICGFGFIIYFNSADKYKEFYNYYSDGDSNDCGSLEHYVTSSNSSNQIEYKLPNGVQFKSILSERPRVDFYFTIPNGKIYSDNTILPVAGPIQIVKNSATYYVCIYPSGKILEQSSVTCPS